MIKRRLKKFLIFLIVFWILPSCLSIGYKPKAHFQIKQIEAASTNLTITACNVQDAANTNCYNALAADGGTSYALAKNSHIDAPLSTLEVSAVNSAMLYYDSWGSLSGTWGIYLKDARDGTTICSVDPAQENSSETTNSTACLISITQLRNGLWLYVINNDDKGSENINLDYVRLAIDYYNPGVSISITTDGSVSFGTLATGVTRDTTASGVNDHEAVIIDSGPADLDIKSSSFTDGGDTWGLGETNGVDQVKWEFSKDGSLWTTFAVADNLYSLDTNVAQGQTKNVYFKITMPASTDSYTQHSSTVTIIASTP